MAVSKILIDGVGIDLTNDTCDYDNMLAGVKAHMNDGEPVTGTIPSKAAATYTPSLSAQTISAGQYLSGKQTISAITKELLANLDADFVAANIKKDVDLFGLIGTFEGGGGGISGVKELITGTYTASSDVTSNVNIEIGKTYTWADWRRTIVVFARAIYPFDSVSYSSIANSIDAIYCHHPMMTSSNGATRYRGSNTDYYTSVKIEADPISNKNYFIVKPSTSMKLPAGVTYRWVVIRLEE